MQAERLISKRHLFIVLFIPVLLLLVSAAWVNIRIQSDLEETRLGMAGFTVIRDLHEAADGMRQALRLQTILQTLVEERPTPSRDAALTDLNKTLAALDRTLNRARANPALADQGMSIPLARLIETTRRELAAPGTNAPMANSTGQDPFLDHLHLLDQMRNLTQAAAVRSHIVLDPRGEAHHLVEMLAFRLPLLADWMSRTESVALALSAHPDPVLTERLAHAVAITEVIQAETIRTRQAFQSHVDYTEDGRNASAAETLTCLTRQVEGPTSAFLAAMAGLPNHPDPQALREAFPLGESAINPLQACSTQLIERLGTLLKERIGELENRRILISGAGILGLLLMVAAMIGFHRRNQMSERALTAEEDRLTTLLDSAVDGICTIDRHGVIHSANRAMYNLFGYPPGSLPGKRVNILMPPPHSEDHDSYLDNHLRTGVRKIIGTIREVEGVCIDGGRFPLELSVSSFMVDGEPMFSGIMHDITARKQASRALENAYAELEARVQKRTQELENANQRLTGEIRDRIKAEAGLKLAGEVFENASEGILVTDANAVIVDVNPAYSAITGYSRDEALGATPKVSKSGRHNRAFYQAMWKALLTEGCWTGEIWDRRKNGEIFPKWLTINAVRDGDGAITHYVGIFSDITHIKATEQRLEQLAYYDPLTSLPNRMLFRDRLEHEMEVARRSRATVGVFFIDLDRFKHVNDTLGHAAGDHLLVEISQRISNIIRKSDTVARLGGDEFTVILAGLERESQAARIAGQIISALQNPVQLGEHEAYVGASIGIALFPNDGEDFDTLTKNADLAMYQSKEAGRGVFRFFEAGMNTDSNNRLMLESRLRGAVQAGEFTVFYQPKFVVAERRVIGTEALVRWERPDLGMVSPDKFIPLAEETGLIIPLGEWILRSACRQTKRWLERGVSLKTAVNLSAVQFTMEDLPETVERILTETGLPAENLELEITESMVMGNLDKAIATMERFRDMGISIAVDDFGTGYSSLSYLKRFPIRALKIDRSFVRDLTEDSDDAAIVCAIISMSHRLDLTVVAEGVETEEQLAFLKSQGCEEMQGYLTGRPMAADDFDRFLEEQATEKA